MKVLVASSRPKGGLISESFTLAPISKKSTKSLRRASLQMDSAQGSDLAHFYEVCCQSEKSFEIKLSLAEHLLFKWIVLRGVVWHLFLKIVAKVKKVLRLSDL